MTKEIIICIVILIVILIGNFITQKYTDQSVKETSNNLKTLREEIIKDDVDKKFSEKKMDEINDMWKKRYNKLAFYIEHDELEKVDTNLTGLDGYLDKEEYGDAVAELDRTVFILEHIKNKSVFNIKNIF